MGDMLRGGELGVLSAPFSRDGVELLSDGDEMSKLLPSIFCNGIVRGRKAFETLFCSFGDPLLSLFDLDVGAFGTDNAAALLLSAAGRDETGAGATEADNGDVVDPPYTF